MKRDLSIRELYKMNKEEINDLHINYESLRSMDEDIYYDDLKYNYDNYSYEYDMSKEKLIDYTCEFLREEILKDKFLLEECRFYLNDIYDNSELYNLYKSGILSDILKDFGIGALEFYSEKYDKDKLLKDGITTISYNSDDNYSGTVKKVIWNCPMCHKENYTVIDINRKDKITCYNCGFETNESQRSKSKGEILVEKLLNKHNLNYKKQHRLYYCENSYPLRYDFIVTQRDKTYYIEVNGLQHYKPISYFGGVNAFHKDKKRYEIKKKHAEENGIFIELDYRESDLGLLKNRFYNIFYNKHIKNKEGEI